MNWSVTVVLVLLAAYIVSETVGFSFIRESFTNPPTISETEPGGYVRDSRYRDGIVDVQGSGQPTDFCRVLRKGTNMGTLHMSCDLGGARDGMNPLEYNTRTVAEGFRLSRDDYWRSRGTKRSDYCRILKDDETGEWYSSCAIASHDGFKTAEERDSNPPPPIQNLLSAYEGILVWFRWHDDREDYAKNAEFTVFGKPEFSDLLRADVSRGLQLNRDLAKPAGDYLRWGETETLVLSQTIQPRQIRAFTFWIWWDAFEKNATVLECNNNSTHDRIAIGIEGGGLDLPSFDDTDQSQSKPKPKPNTTSAKYYFEIWDSEQRIMRLNAPMSSARINQWQHIAITTTDDSAWWPTWQMWINGVLVAEKKEGRMSPAMEIQNATIGRGVRGCLKDFRVYKTSTPLNRLTDMIQWGKSGLVNNP